MVSCVGMKMACFVRRLTMTRMEVKPSDLGSCLMKSMEMESHGLSAMGSCLSMQYRRCRWALERAQVVQDLQYSRTNLWILGHVYSQRMILRVLFCPKWPTVGWSWVMSPFKDEFYVREKYGSSDRFTLISLVVGIFL
jgi:hypothetical protein